MNQFLARAKEHEIKFWRQWRKSARFITCTERENIIKEVTREYVVLRSESNESAELKIRRERLREAIAAFLYRRTITRDELQRYCAYNSALWAVLRTIFCHVVKVKKSRGIYCLVLKGPRFFPSGMDRCVRDLEIAVACGIEFVLMSYAYLRDRNFEEWLKFIQRLGVFILLDSSAFTVFQMMQKGKPVKPINVEELADFALLLQSHGILYGLINLDVIGDPIASKSNYDYLVSRGLAPIPVWHCQSELAVLADVVSEGHEVIAIGGSVPLKSQKRRKQIFSLVFDRFPDQLFHLLGGASRLILDYAFFSFDATTPLAASKYGRVLRADLRQMDAPADWSKEKRLAINFTILFGVEEGDLQKTFLYEVLVHDIASFFESKKDSAE